MLSVAENRLVYHRNLKILLRRDWAKIRKEERMVIF
jgi:hypothetical protein